MERSLFDAYNDAVREMLERTRFSIRDCVTRPATQDVETLATLVSIRDKMHEHFRGVPEDKPKE